jgi:hypothetical protein
MPMLNLERFISERSVAKMADIQAAKEVFPPFSTRSYLIKVISSDL